MDAQQGYRLLAGKCKRYCEAIIAVDPAAGWILVRGHYFEPQYGAERPHWWLKSPDGVIYDPTRDQFPSHGLLPDGYTEFDGNVECAQCHKTMKEEEAEIDGNYAFCSHMCHGRFVGIY